MQLQYAFTTAHRAAIEALRCDLTRRVQRTVTAEYGETEDGTFHDVALCVESLPAGAWGEPGVLVSILTGAGIGGDGFVVLAAAGDPLADGVDLAHAVQSARFTAVRQYREMAKGALKVA
jgi:hypothetical protein